MRWKVSSSNGAPRTQPAPDSFHSWILSLPWVVERPYSLGTPGVRTFAIACDPLAIRQLWLVTGLPNGHGIAVIVPIRVAERLELASLGREIAPMSAQHGLLAVRHDATSTEIERVILEAYGTVLS